MSAKYSDEFIRSVLGASSTSPLGTRLARLCVEVGFPAVYVAQVLGVSRMTLHSWFRGGKIRMAKVEKIQMFMQLIREDITRGRLPAKNAADAKEYLQEMTDVPLKASTQRKTD